MAACGSPPQDLITIYLSRLRRCAELRKAHQSVSKIWDSVPNVEVQSAQDQGWDTQKMLKVSQRPIRDSISAINRLEGSAGRRSDTPYRPASARVKSFSVRVWHGCRQCSAGKAEHWRFRFAPRLQQIFRFQRTEDCSSSENAPRLLL